MSDKPLYTPVIMNGYFQASAADVSFDLSDITTSRVGIACAGDDFATTRFARVDKLVANEQGLCLQVTYDTGETEVAHISRVSYVDGKHVGK